MTEAIVFDFDGVIGNSMPRQCEAWERAIASFQDELSETQKETLLRNFWAGNAGDLMFNDTGLEGELKARLRKAKDRIWNEQQYHVQPIEGAVAAVKQLYADYLLAIATTGHRKYVLDCLERFQLMECFQLIIAREDVNQLKPAPDALLIIADFLSVPAHHITLIGDTQSDKGMAAAAGSRFIQLKADGRKSEAIQDASYADWPSLLQAIT